MRVQKKVSNVIRQVDVLVRHDTEDLSMKRDLHRCHDQGASKYELRYLDLQHR